MISFRYHLVSIVALFLALGLGVLAGTTVIDQQLVDGLRDRIERAEATRDDLQMRGDTASARSSRQEELFEELLGEQLQAQLDGTDVVIVASSHIDRDLLAPVQQAFEASGATVRGSFAVSDRTLQSDAQESLSTVIPGGAAALPGILAARLADGPSGDGDPLLGLLSDGFLVPLGRDQVGEDDLATIGGPGQVVVVLGGHASDPVVQKVLLPLTGDLVRRAVPTAAGESADPEDQLIGLLRSDSALREVLVTVDNADEPVGSYAMVVGVSDLLRTGEGGAYGSKQGAQSLYPPR